MPSIVTVVAGGGTCPHCGHNEYDRVADGISKQDWICVCRGCGGRASATQRLEDERRRRSADFSAYRHLASAADVRAWVDALVAVEGGVRDLVSYPEDCEVIVTHFARVGVALTPGEAQAVWDVYSAKDCAGWVGPAADCVAGLDWIVEETKDGSIGCEHVRRALAGWSPGDALPGEPSSLESI